MAAAKSKTPVYLRLVREKSPVVTTDASPFEIGKASILWEPVTKKADVGIIATGALVYKALQAAVQLEKEKIGVTVMNLSTIKPLDEKAIIKLAKDTKAIVTVEEHQIAGGMGSAVAECLAKYAPTPQEFVGIKDEFGQSGNSEELIEHYGMGQKGIVEAVKRVLKRK